MFSYPTFPDAEIGYRRQQLTDTFRSAGHRREGATARRLHLPRRSRRQAA